MFDRPNFLNTAKGFRIATIRVLFDCFQPPLSSFALILQHLAKWFILLHVKHFFPQVRHFILPPACEKVPPQEKHTFPAVLLCACYPSDITSPLDWCQFHGFVGLLQFFPLAYPIAKSRPSVRVWGLLSTRRLTHRSCIHVGVECSVIQDCIETSHFPKKKKKNRRTPRRQCEVANQPQVRSALSYMQNKSFFF